MVRETDRSLVLALLSGGDDPNAAFRRNYEN
jgi:hypothetical protein